MKKKKKNRVNVVYSTNPDFKFEELHDAIEEALEPAQQQLYISLDRKNRGGKEVTLVEGFIGLDEDLKTLAKTLKSKCGVGGSMKNSEVMIQGNFVEKVYLLLTDMGYSKVKKKGGY